MRLAGGGHRRPRDDLLHRRAPTTRATTRSTLFDLDLLPERHATTSRTSRGFDEARMRTAHERCRRFDLGAARAVAGRGAAPRRGACRGLGAAAARVRSRHQCRLRRSAGVERTRGLFLTAGAFLVSYDPDRRPEGTLLDRLMAAIFPVGAGINLEYYFSHVDPDGLGCGTKLPHNITGLLGVMDGSRQRSSHRSALADGRDPRAGAPSDRRRGDPGSLAADRRGERRPGAPAAEPLGPNGGVEFGRPPAGVVHAPRIRAAPPRRARSCRGRRSSRAWYGGRRGFLPYACIRA